MLYIYAKIFKGVPSINNNNSKIMNAMFIPTYPIEKLIQSDDSTQLERFQKNMCKKLLN